MDINKVAEEMEQLFARAAASHAAALREFRSIDNFHARRRGVAPKKYDARAALTLHDLAVNNPVLREQLRAIQDGKF